VKIFCKKALTTETPVQLSFWGIKTNLRLTIQCTMCMNNILRDLHTSKLPALCKICTQTTFWKTFTSENSQHCAKCACTIFWGTFTSGNWQHCAKCAHTQHSERPSYQGPDDTVRDVCNILRDLQVRGLMALLKMCTHTTFWKTFTSGSWWYFSGNWRMWRKAVLY